MFALLVMLACADPEAVMPTPDTIAYHFQDASVPPPHHRSYTITASATEARVVVDSYGEVLNDHTVKLEAGAFDAVAKLAAGVRSAERPEKGPGCTGGTGESLTLSADGKVVLKGSLQHCGGDTSGTLAGELTELKKALQGLFGSDFRALLKD